MALIAVQESDPILLPGIKLIYSNRTQTEAEATKTHIAVVVVCRYALWMSSSHSASHFKFFFRNMHVAKLE